MTFCNIRFLVDAIRHIRDGRDVVIVAFPTGYAFALAEMIEDVANSEGYPCVLSERRDGPERKGDVPLVIPRPFGWKAESTPSCRARPVVMIDQSAVFERTNFAPPKYRCVGV